MKQQLMQAVKNLPWLRNSMLLCTLGLLSMATHADIAKPQATVCAAQQYLMALKYQQQSAEIQALQFQSYALATQRLKEILQQHPNAKNLAIVTDLDETVIDNSEVLVRDVQHCVDHTNWQSWEQWEQHGQPKLIPGSLAFLNFADQHQLKIFYVSDRSEKYRANTIAQLKQLGLPQLVDQHVLLYGKSKQQRRQSISEKYQIVLLLGDTLHDFHSDFSNQQNKAERQAMVNKHQQHFGQDWIMLPNVSYGSWSKDPFSQN